MLNGSSLGNNGPSQISGGKSSFLGAAVETTVLKNYVKCLICIQPFLL